MPLTDQGNAGAIWPREVIAGCAGALTVLPVVLTLVLLAFSARGAAAPQVGMLVAFVTASIGSAVHAALSRTQLPASGPSSATALTLATLVMHLVADPRLSPATATGVHNIVALCGLALVLSGVLQVGFALLGLARLARLAPQPVLAGFMNSAALLVVLSQLPLLLDLPPGARLHLDSLAVAQPAALALGLGTAGCIWLLAWRRPQLPAALLGLVIGALVHALWSTLGGATSAGATVGPLPSAWPWPPAVLPLLGPGGLALLQSHAVPLATTALALAALGALESSLNVRAMDQMLNTRHDPQRELVALGCGNMVCGLLGGVPLAASRMRALATLQAGGRGRLSVLVGTAALGLLYLLGGPLLAVLPLPVLAGVMLTVAVALADRWTGRLLARCWAGDRSRDVVLGLATVALVVGTSWWLGIAAGIGLGVLLSLVSFAARMNRSLVHDRYPASARPSRRIYPATVEARLGPLREGIFVFELDGALFFGSGDQLLDDADALPERCRCLVLDLRRVSAIDESGAVALQQTLARAKARGIQMLLAGLIDGSAAAQALRSFAPDVFHGPHWPDADRAIEAAEQRLLADMAPDDDARAMAEVPLAAASLLAGLDAAQVAVVAAHLQARHLAAGEALFAEGDAGDRLYLVSQGSVSILSTPDSHGRTQRYLSVSPGMMLGETAMLDGGGRTAGAVADAPTVVHALTLGALDQIGRTHPEVVTRLYRNVALHLSQRLRGATGAWRTSAR
jgi:SulP family sulfate permease